MKRCPTCREKCAIGDLTHVCPPYEELADRFMRAEDSRESYKDLWNQSCQAVSELCDLAGAPYGSMHDLWTLKAAIERLNAKTEAPKGPQE